MTGPGPALCRANGARGRLGNGDGTPSAVGETGALPWRPNPPEAKGGTPVAAHVCSSAEAFLPCSVAIGQRATGHSVRESTDDRARAGCVTESVPVLCCADAHSFPWSPPAAGPYPYLSHFGRATEKANEGERRGLGHPGPAHRPFECPWNVVIRGRCIVTGMFERLRRVVNGAVNFDTLLTVSDRELARATGEGTAPTGSDHEEWLRTYVEQLARVATKSSRQSQLVEVRSQLIAHSEGLAVTTLIQSDQFSEDEREFLAAWLIPAVPLAEIHAYRQRTITSCRLSIRCFRAVGARLGDTSDSDWLSWYEDAYALTMDAVFRQKIAGARGDVYAPDEFMRHASLTIEQARKDFLQGHNFPYRPAVPALSRYRGAGE